MPVRTSAGIVVKNSAVVQVLGNLLTDGTGILRCVRRGMSLLIHKCMACVHQDIGKIGKVTIIFTLKL